MAYRIHNSIIKGEIDNTRRGVVTGRIWLTNRAEPIELELAGNCWCDLAGRRCTFVNPATDLEASPELATRQTGEVGDMTASRKVLILDVPIQAFREHIRMGMDVPEHTENCLYFEWYSDTNGRVVIESPAYELNVSLPEWEMTEKEQQRQCELNAEAMRRFLDRLEAGMCPGSAVRLPTDRDMDEFEWERFLQQSDAKTERLGELMDKFGDHPDSERIIARHMGWDGLLKAMDAQESNEEEVPAWDLPDIDNWDEPEPDPETEGKDWIRDKRGNIRHPLQHRCQQFSIRMFIHAKSLGLKEADLSTHDQDVDDMVFNVQRTAAKIAGALNTVAQGGIDPLTGFVVATLKRALSLLHEALSAMESVKKSGKMAGVIDGYRAEAFAIRTSIIDLMERYRHPK